MARRSRFVLGLCLALLTACGVTGSGEIVSEERVVGAFDRIEVSGGLNLRLTVETGAAAAVTVNYDDNVIDLIETEVVGSTLRIHSDGMYNISSGDDRYVGVAVGDLTGLEASGGSNVVGQGEAGDLEVVASGGANLDLAMLPVAEMTLRASGGANVIVSVTDAVVGEASGGADVVVEGSPAQQGIETSGGAEVSYG